MKLGQQGFTLIEVLMAMAMISIALTVSIYTSQGTLNTYQHSRKAAAAHRLASSTMEELLARYASDPQLAAGVHTQEYDNDVAPVVSNGIYKSQWTITNDDPVASIKKIQLDITFDVDGATRGVHFTTYRGMY